jgi:hypothetical protein
MTTITAPKRVCHYETQSLDPATLLSDFGARGAWFAACVTALDMGHEPESDPVGNESVFVTFTLNGSETYYAMHYYQETIDACILRESYTTFYRDPEMCDEVDDDDIEFLAHDGSTLPLRDLDDLIRTLADAVRM